MFTPICVVVRTNTIPLVRPRSEFPIVTGTVTICKKTKPVNDDYWEWDLSELEIMPVEAFRKWLSYDSIPGYWADSFGERHTYVTTLLEEECHATQ
jgi:hypothetical protein